MRTSVRAFNKSLVPTWNISKAGELRERTTWAIRSKSLPCIQCRLRAQVRRYASQRSTSMGNTQNSAKQQVEQASQPVSAFKDGLGHQPYPANNSPNPSLPSQAEYRRSHISKRFTSLMDHLQSNVFLASQRLNDLTGYSGIETLKRSIESQETFVQQARAAVRAAKDAYSTAISQRSASQREVNELLQRKHAWTPQDLERFAALYRSDHANEQTEIKAAEELAAAERVAEEAQAKLGRSILARYHEEQIWSDKIRRMSTWGTWGLMGVNVLLFVIFQVGVEPWRRKRLVSGFEEKVREAIVEREKLADTTPIHQPEAQAQEEVHTTETIFTPEPQITPTPPPPPTPYISTSSATSLTQHYRSRIQHLFSNQTISLRRIDLTTMALQSAAAGAGITLCCCGIAAVLGLGSIRRS